MFIANKREGKKEGKGIFIPNWHRKFQIHGSSGTLTIAGWKKIGLSLYSAFKTLYDLKYFCF